MHSSSRRILNIGLIVATILAVPLVAMQFTDEVQWDLFDFVIMGGVLFGFGLAYELIGRRSEKTVYRAAFALGLAGAFFLFWISGAVGIIGSENNSANLMYTAVFAVGFIGAFLSWFRARGMSYTLFAAAFVQFVIPVIALVAWPSTMSWGEAGIFGVFVLNAFFAACFFVSGLLFQRAAAQKNHSHT